jgi:hypothetical protein
MASVSLAAYTVDAQSADAQTGAAPMADVTGPGQAVPQPAPQCPHTIGCQYAEQSLLPDSYLLQSLKVCGANCTSQYWVSGVQDGQQLLEIDPVRGGAVLAVGHASSPDDRAPVRVVMPQYARTDPACCPSTYTDTTYDWDAASNSLVVADVTTSPADQFAGWDAVRQELTAEGWIVANI